VDALNRFFFAQHLDDDESIVYVAHTHWFFAIKGLFLPTLVLIGLGVLAYEMPTKYMFYGTGIAALAAAVWWFSSFLDYFLDVWLITNMGVIDLEWKGWFHRTSARVLYSDMEGLTYEIKGIIATILGYGDVTLQKISTGSTVTMLYVPRPRAVESTVLKAMETYLHSKNLKDSKTVQTLLADFVAGSMQKDALASKKTK
jgi:hypothetical protein